MVVWVSSGDAMWCDANAFNRRYYCEKRRYSREGMGSAVPAVVYFRV